MSKITKSDDTHAPIPAITNETFEAKVMQSQMPVLVDFSAEWCAPCRLMHNVLSELAVELRERLRIVTVDVDRDPVHAGQLGVRGMPTLFLFHDGKILSHKTGAAPKAVVRCWIEDTIGKA
jgi:thioredoxin 1